VHVQLVEQFDITHVDNYCV